MLIDESQYRHTQLINNKMHDQNGCDCDCAGECNICYTHWTQQVKQSMEWMIHEWHTNAIQPKWNAYL